MADQPHDRRQDGLAPTRDTIAAVATPPGRGGIGIVRISGPNALLIARALLGITPRPRHAHLASFRGDSGEALDTGLALYFPGPHSFTGEDVLELHGHGGAVVLDMLLARVLSLGARPARPGEFSERAFLNGKLDLAQAEAIADLIEAGSQSAARAAMRSMDGEFSRRVHALLERLIVLRTHIEAAIDFAEEEIDFLADERIGEQLAGLQQAITALTYAARQGQRLHDGLTVVIAGPPNAGKSSLLNRLACADTAIVSATPGTTRDLLREQIQIDGLPLHVIDTAGLRDTADEVEREGVRRAQTALGQADLALLVVDDSIERAEGIARLRAQLPPELPVLLVRNKIDLSARPPGAIADADLPTVALSALSGEGLDALRVHVKHAAGFTGEVGGAFSARRRHLDALARTAQHIDRAEAALGAGRAGELMAEELRLAQQALAEITGEFGAEALLGRIFSSFCIGK